jgi:hypothetical protein
MTAQSGDAAGDRSVPWALDHPGIAAVVSVLAAITGLVLVVAGLAGLTDSTPGDILGYLWSGIPLLLGALMFVAGLPASFGFCGASCVTQRELWGGLIGGFVGVMVTLVAVGVVLPL